jgi:RHS repeat-associated protein
VKRTPTGRQNGHADHLNTPRAVFDDQQQLQWKWDQEEPFGVNLPDENVAGRGVFGLPLRFPGQYLDKETGLSQNLHRNYSSEAGRFNESDPIGIFGGINTYLYVDADPLLKRDINGLSGRAPGRGRPNINGNVWGEYTEQDWICSSFGYPFNWFKCTKQCCDEHDRCFEKYRCNATSWVGNLMGTGFACQECNHAAFGCMLANIGRTKCVGPVCDFK